ncbi:Protein of unknown function (DUF1517) [Deinococcus peraridilitoris DSM 19664]|uniref:Uncharacterized protein n=2 Tax=Deinococcus TaxID=1298 RepID=L0A5J7_DEIPD|nr:Protein of unknown function (DUF1517) [Deinococcus peraridilitoris DSM 19664]
MNRSLVALLLALLTLVSALADARGRSGGGFGGSRSYRTPYRTPSYRSPTPIVPNRVQPRLFPRSTVRPINPGFRGHFFFLPFFGLNPYGFFGLGYGAGWGLLGLLFNLILVVALASFLLWLIRRRR